MRRTDTARAMRGNVQAKAGKKGFGAMCDQESHDDPSPGRVESHGREHTRFAHFTLARLEHEINFVGQQLGELADRRLSSAMVAGSAGAGTGFEPAHVREQNRQVDTGGNRSGLEAKLIDLRRELRRRQDR